MPGLGEGSLDPVQSLKPVTGPGTNTVGKFKTIKCHKSCLFLHHFKISCIIKIKISFGKVGTQNSNRNMPLITNQ